MKLKSLIDCSKNTQPQTLTEEQAKLFMTLTLLEREDPDKVPLTAELPFTFKVLDSRLKHHGKDNVSFHCKLFLASLCNSPGKSVMWAYTLAHILELEGGAKVTMGVLSKYFPWGFPSEEAQMACWDDQKGHAHDIKADNLMDMAEWWEA